MSATVQREEIKVISPHPLVAEFLEGRDNKILPKNVYDFGVNWIADVGAVLRSRDFLVSTVASYASYGIQLLLWEAFPVLSNFKRVSRVLGVK